MTLAAQSLMRGGGLLAVAGWLLAASPALSEPCRTPTGSAKPVASRTGCKPEDRLQPYDPDAARAGRQPGFVDLGNGTEVRVGGRVQMDYGVRR